MTVDPPPACQGAAAGPSGSSVWPGGRGPADAALGPGCRRSPDTHHAAPCNATGRRNPGEGVFQRRRNQGGGGAKLNGCAAAAPYLQDQRVAPGHVLLRRHVEEGEAHAQAVERVVGVSLESLGILTCKAQSHREFQQSHYSFRSLFFIRKKKTLLLKYR